jgi:hypothetical protein
MGRRTMKRADMLVLLERLRLYADAETRAAGHDVRWFKPRAIYGFAMQHAKCRRCHGRGDALPRDEERQGRGRAGRLPAADLGAQGGEMETNQKKLCRAAFDREMIGLQYGEEETPAHSDHNEE